MLTLDYALQYVLHITQYTHATKAKFYPGRHQHRPFLTRAENANDQRNIICIEGSQF
jgi:hypothetical protein